MTKEDIIRMAREAGISESHAQGMQGFLERFAALVAAAEREECAKVCEEIDRNGAWVTKLEAADAIRARSKQ